MLDTVSRPPSPPDHIGLAAEIAAAYVSRNSLPIGDLPALLRSVHDTLVSVSSSPAPAPVPEPLRPAVPIRKSVQDEYIVCLENGKRFKSLKRDLATTYGLTPDEYRAKWGLPKDYPMVAPAYANARSTLARQMGLGRKPGDAKPGPDEPEAEAEADVSAETQPEVEPQAAPARPPKRRRKADADG